MNKITRIQEPNSKFIQQVQVELEKRPYFYPEEKMGSSLFTDNFATKGIILDIGCGCGIGTNILANSLPSNTIIGLDINPQAIEYATKRYRKENLSFKIGNVYHLSKNFSEVGGAFIGDSLHHFDNLELAIEQISKTLISKGKLFFYDVNREIISDIYTPLDLGNGHKLSFDQFFLSYYNLTDMGRINMIESLLNIKTKEPLNHKRQILYMISLAAGYDTLTIEKSLTKKGFTNIEIYLNKKVYRRIMGNAIKK